MASALAPWLGSSVITPRGQGNGGVLPWGKAAPSGMREGTPRSRREQDSPWGSTHTPQGSTYTPWGSTHTPRARHGRAPTPLISCQSAAPTARTATRRCLSGRKSLPSSSGATRRCLPTAPAKPCGEYTQLPPSLAPWHPAPHPRSPTFPTGCSAFRDPPKRATPKGCRGWRCPALALGTHRPFLDALSQIAPKSPVSAASQKNGKEDEVSEIAKSQHFWGMRGAGCCRHRQAGGGTPGHSRSLHPPS